MKRTAIFSTLLITSLTTTLLAGCSGNKPVIPEPPVSTPTTAITATVAPTPTEEAIPTILPTERPVATPVPTKVPELTEIPTPTEEVTESITPEPTKEVIPTESPVITEEITPTAKPTSTPKPTVTPAPTATPTPVPVTGITVNDYILFGTYEQDADLTNGKEPIEWLVLDVKDGKAFLLSKHVLEWMPFDSNYDAIAAFEAAVAGNPSDYHCTWGASTIRTWLNDDFYKEAFDAKEQESILLSEVENLPNQLRGVSSGPDTKDKVYLLSESEAIQYFGEYYTIVSDDNRPIWMGEEVPEQTNQLSAPTEYTLSENHGMQLGWCRGEWDNTYCAWSLRTTGGLGIGCAAIQADGFLDQDGGFADGNSGIRPCLWIDLEIIDEIKAE